MTPPLPRSDSTAGTVLAASILVVLTLATFLPAVAFDFVNWDDPWYVTQNPLIRSWEFDNLRRIATESVARNYAPLTVFSLLVDHTLWGRNPVGYHLTNILLHSACVVLAFLLLRRLSGTTWLAWTAAALFAVHPVQVETVAWVSSRKGLMCGVFLLGSLLCWLQKNRTPKHEMWGIGLLALALLSKALAVVVPAIVLSYDIIIRRQRLADALPRQIVPGFLALWLLTATMAAQTTIVGGTRAHLGLSKPEILAVDGVILTKYVGLLLWPRDLCVLYDVPTQNLLGPAALAWAGWLLLVVVAWKLRQRWPWLAFAVACWFLLLAPVLNLFPLTTLMNDRYLYLPCLPFFAVVLAGARLLVVLLGDFVGRVSGPSRFGRVEDPSNKHAWPTVVGRGVILGAVLAVVFAAATATRERLHVWQNGLTLWRDAVTKSPGLTVVQIQWANTLHDHGRVAEARSALLYALQHCRPDEIDRRRIQDKLHAWFPARGTTSRIRRARVTVSPQVPADDRGAVRLSVRGRAR